MESYKGYFIDGMLRVDNQDVTSFFQLYKLLNGKAAGKAVPVRVQREDKVLDFAPVLIKR